MPRVRKTSFPACIRIHLLGTAALVYSLALGGFGGRPVRHGLGDKRIAMSRSWTQSQYSGPPPVLIGSSRVAGSPSESDPLFRLPTIASQKTGV